MITEKQYKSLLEFARHYLRSKPHLCTDDIVNDVLIKIIESGEPYKAVKAEAMVKHHPDVSAIPLSKLGHEFCKSETQKVCKDCKEVLPVGMFYIHNQPAMQVLSSYCRDCFSKRTSKWSKSEAGKASNRERQRRFRERRKRLLKAA